jgi:hypothetical protein
MPLAIGAAIRFQTSDPVPEACATLRPDYVVDDVVKAPETGALPSAACERTHRTKPHSRLRGDSKEKRAFRRILHNRRRAPPLPSPEA